MLLSSNAYAKVGKGELKLSKSTMNNLMQYLYGAGNSKYSGDAKKKNQPMLMAISEDGNSSYYYYCPYVHCEIQSYEYLKQLSSVKNYPTVAHVICLQKKEVSNGKIL